MFSIREKQLDVDLAVNGLSSVTDLLRFALTALCYALEGGVKHSVLNMNAMLCSHYSIHVYYALLSL